MTMLNDIKNYRKWVTIERDGTTKEKLILSLQDKRRREEIIAYHFQKFYKDAYGIMLPSLLIGRDNPHDFTFGNAVGLELHLEIISASDTSKGFCKHSHHAKLEELLKDEPLSVVAAIPWNAGKKDIEMAVKDMKNYPPINDFINGPIDVLNQRVTEQKPVIRRFANDKKRRIFLTDGVNEPIVKIINIAIRNKEVMPYKYINDMTLIIDDQLIMYGRDDIARAWLDLVFANKKSPFKEIFLYSGYYANEDGNNAEFTIWPIKCAHESAIQWLDNHPLQTYWIRFKRLLGFE